MKLGRLQTVLAVSALAAFLVAFPFFASTFLVQEIATQAMWLGIVALSMVFLAGYGGMVSFLQPGLYGVAAYVVAVATVNDNYEWYVAVLLALAFSTGLAFLFGLLAVRTSGIYFLMITLAMGLIIYYFASDNYTVLNGSTGINGVNAPTIGRISFSDPRWFYFLCLATSVIVYTGLSYLGGSQFGLALQGVRDNPRRMRALGYWVEAHRLAAFVVAGFVAGIGGVLGVWFNGSMAPPYIDLTRIVDFLVIAVLGGMSSLGGAFVGAVVFTLVTTYASSWTDRYNTVIGLIFLVIVLFVPNGLGGLGPTIRDRVLQISLRPRSSSTTQEGFRDV